MRIEEERKAFNVWHLKQFKDINNDLSDDEAEYLYQRVYSHKAQDLIRQMEFNAWLASANRQGYKLVPVDPSERMQEIGMEHIPTIDCQPYDAGMVYKAMIKAVDE